MSNEYLFFLFLSNGLTNSEEIRFSRSSSLFCPALDAINCSCRKIITFYSLSWGRQEQFGGRSILWCCRNISTADQLSAGGLALVKSGVKGTEATMQAHRKTPKLCKYFCIHACPVLKLTYRLPDRKWQHTQLHYHNCQTLIFNKITFFFFF